MSQWSRDYCGTSSDRPSAGSTCCSKSACKVARKAHRAAQHAPVQLTEQDIGSGYLHEAGEMPDDMELHGIKESLGERCCEQHAMNKLQRKNGLRSSHRASNSWCAAPS